MPKRRQKRQDTSNSDDYDEQMNMQRKVHFGSVQLNRFLPPDQIKGDDANKYSILAWSNTLQAQRLLPWLQRKQLFERALKYLPNSYKIWHSFLTQFMQYCSTRSVYSKQYSQLNKTFQLALQKLPRMPRIWLLYTQCLQKQHKISKTRQVFNWSFRNLPLTQHNKIWHKFSLWSMKLDNSNTALTVIPRYIKLNPDFKEQYVDYLKRRNMIEKSVEVLLDILKDQGYYSKQGKSKKDFEYDIIDLLIQYPDKQYKINGQQMIKQCITKYPSQQGQLWVKLTDYYIRKGQFQFARSTFQQSIIQIDNTKDFGIIFNAYTKFQQQMITALANEQIQQYAQINKQDNLQYEIQQRLNKLQQLIDRQPYILSQINIKRTPNDVKAWENYAQLYYKNGEIDKCIDTINEAIEKIQPQNAQNGMLSSLWIKLASIYQQQQQIRQCNQIFNQATHVNFKMVQDYFNIWISWIQMLLQQQYYQDGLKVVKHVLFRRKNQVDNQKQLKIKNIDDLLRANISLWQLYIDIQICIGTFENIKTAYQRCKQHKCLTPIMLLNYTNFLWQNAFFQQTFRVFEFAVNSFKWPSLYQIWISYIHKFITRYGNDLIGTQRCRSMFQRLLKSCPIEHIGIFHYLYAKFQQQHGMISYSINIYDSMINKVPKQQRAKAYQLYICKVAKMLGITKTRAIFEAALQKLTEKEVLSIGKQYAELQKNLGEIQRARAVYVYVSQFTDPRDDMDQLWEKWENFEVENGDKQTYKEYLRIKRSVEAKFQMLPPDLAKIQEKVKKGLI